ncbi:protein GRAVITROPIC IN THE LIGHT 1-like [Miscanthus floridulus]|uniref:protein GRAVITROPIC IN THE LIGHT 1-like n=1 Tax=Miscanthus floridulus TaxID=154761 RepID=UPI00345A73A6
MESSPAPARSARAPPTPTCTVPGLLVGLTKLFNLTKVCAAPTPAADDGNAEAAATTKPGHDPDPDPGPDPRLVLARLFDAVSALKSGYVKLQRAHFPYDPDKVALAGALASELDSVASLQCLCTSRRGIGPLVDDRWAQVQRLEAEARRRDAHIAALARELRRLQRDNARLSRQLVVRSRNDDRRRGAGISLPKELATPAALVRQFVAASRSVCDFAELLLGNGTCSLTTAAAAASSPEPCVVSDDADSAAAAEQARSWRRYSLEAHLWRAMLLVGAEECCGGDAGSSFQRIMKPRDALDALMQFPRSGLSAFCRAAYIAAVPPEAEAAACGNLDHRAFVSRGGHPRTPLYRAFAAAARSVWALRVLMTAVAPCSESELGSGDGGGGVRMFYAGRGSLYAAEFMESVPALSAEEARRLVAGEEEKLSVAFTVTPGVKVGDTVVPCRVLLCRRRKIASF